MTANPTTGADPATPKKMKPAWAQAGEAIELAEVSQHTDGTASQRRLRGLLRANRVVLEEEPSALPVVLRRIMESARELLRAPYGALGVTGSSGDLEQLIYVGADQDAADQVGEVPPEAKGLLRLLLTSSESVRVRDLRRDQRWAGFVADDSTAKSFLGAPIRVREEVLGSLYLAGHNDGAVSTEDEELIASLAATAGIAIQNTRLVDEARRREIWMKASTQITRQLLTADGDDPLRVIARQVQVLADADAVNVVVQTSGAGRHVVKVATGAGAEQLTAQSVPIQSTVCQVVVDTGQPMLIPDVAAEQQYTVHLSKVVPVGPLMALPLIGAGKIRGVFLVGRLRGRPQFTAADLDMSTTFANHAALALELSDARDAQNRVEAQDQSEVRDDQQRIALLDQAEVRDDQERIALLDQGEVRDDRQRMALLNQAGVRDDQERIALLDQAEDRDDQQRMALLDQAGIRDDQERIALLDQAEDRDDQQRIALLDQAGIRDELQRIALLNQAGIRDDQQRAALLDQAEDRDVQQRMALLNQAGIRDDQLRLALLDQAGIRDDQQRIALLALAGLRDDEQRMALLDQAGIRDEQQRSALLVLAGTRDVEMRAALQHQANDSDDQLRKALSDQADASNDQQRIALRDQADASDDQQRIATVLDRDRIARDLHDHVIQRLFGAGLTVESIAAGLSGDARAIRLARVVRDLDETIRQIRTSIFQLRGPLGPKTGGVRSGLLAIATELSMLLGFEPVVTFTGPVDAVVPDDVLDDVIAVVREALTNVARHANATQVHIEVTVENGKLAIELSDDGVGVGEADQRRGLANLERRSHNHGGGMTVTSPHPHPGSAWKDGGTRLRWSVPLGPAPKPGAEAVPYDC